VNGTVRVRFVDVDAGTLLAESDLPAEALPESFAARTTLQLGEDSWEVMRAEPLTRVQSVRDGQLLLALRRLAVQHVSPEKILYSLPTLCQSIAAILPGSTKRGLRLCELHEDDWRQVEFVSQTHAALVRQELEQIERLLAARNGAGFAEIHVRRQPTSPLVDCHVTMAIVERALPGAEAYDGLAYEAGAGLIENGFAYLQGELRLYGLTLDGVVVSLGLERAPAALPDSLRALAYEHGLMLVDWCGARILA
jgi:hypothetical protein